jgi:hypothetical protein
MVSCAPNLGPQPLVPEEYRRSQLVANGSPESVRYRQAFEAFWWNCAALKGVDLDARCPFACSGTPAATYGCGDGEQAAREAVARLVAREGQTKAQAILRARVSRSDAQRALKLYFPNGPEMESIRSPHIE